MPGFNQALGYYFSGKRENTQQLNDMKKFLFVVIVSVVKVIPSICNVAKEET